MFTKKIEIKYFIIKLSDVFDLSIILQKIEEMIKLIEEKEDVKVVEYINGKELAQIILEANYKAK